METCTYGLGEGNRKPAAAMSKGADCLSHLESAYEAACVIEMRNRGLNVEQQVIYPFFYDGEMAGAYIADLVIENRIVLELKSVEALSRTMQAQLLNYLRLSKLNLGILVNFRNMSLEWKRMVLSD